MSIRVLLADDNARYVESLIDFLQAQEDLDVVGAVGDGKAAVCAYEELRPDIVLMDVFMPDVDGLEATGRITEQHPESRIVVLTGHDNDELRRKCSQCGAMDFVSKRSAPDMLLDAIRLAVSRTDTTPPQTNANRPSGQRA